MVLYMYTFYNAYFLHTVKCKLYMVNLSFFCIAKVYECIRAFYYYIVVHSLSQSMILSPSSLSLFIGNFFKIIITRFINMPHGIMR